MGRADGLVALISGGARGMGASHARMLVDEGASVVIGDVLDDEGAATAAGLGDAARYIHLDVTNEDDWGAAVAATEERFGPVSLLVNNAGIVVFGAIDEIDPADFRRLIDINLFGTFLGMRSAIPSLRRAGGGTIVNVSSTAGMMGYAGIVAYVASKWGVRGMTKTAAMELGRDGIRVCSIHPGPIRTPMTDGMGDEMTATQPIARFGEPEEVSELVLFLATKATYSTGSEFIIDGGALLGPVLELPSE
jgi:3alpha(or 20beta)-hydroxysteroid dehydrogenase